MPLINGTQKASFSLFPDTQWLTDTTVALRVQMELISKELWKLTVNFLLPHLQMLVITTCFTIDPYYIDICLQFFAPAKDKKEK